MKPVDLKKEGYQDVVILAEGQDEYANLPAVLNTPEPGTVWTCWDFTDTEREAIADGAYLNMFTSTFGKPFSPVRFSIGKRRPPVDVPLDEIPLDEIPLAERPQGGL